MAKATTRYPALGVVVSIAVHAGVFAALGAMPRAAAPPTLLSAVEFVVPPVAEKPPPPPPPPPPPAPALAEDPPQPLSATPAAGLEPRSAPPVASPEPEPVDPRTEPQVADLTGLTLTNDTGEASWGSTVGNGNKMTGPLRGGRASGSKGLAPKPAPAKPAARGPSVVPVADLSERPIPPKLDSLLKRNYPKVARQQGKSGSALIRLRIDPDGRVRRANIIRESDTGFGTACRSTVLGSQWSPPRDHQGKSVATFVNYTCRFQAQ